MLERAMQMVAELPDKFSQSDLIPILYELESLDLDNTELIQYLRVHKVQLWIFDPINRYKIGQLVEIIDMILGNNSFFDYYSREGESYDSIVEQKTENIQEELQEINQVKDHSDLDSTRDKVDNELYSDLAEKDIPSNEAVVGFEEPEAKQPKTSAEEYQKRSIFEDQFEKNILILDHLFEFLNDNPNHKSIAKEIRKNKINIFDYRIAVPSEVLEYILGEQRIQTGLKIIDRLETRFLLQLKQIPHILNSTRPIEMNFCRLIGVLRGCTIFHFPQFVAQNVIFGQFDLHLQNLKFIAEISTNSSYKLVYQGALCIPVIIQNITVFSGFVGFDIDLVVTFTDRFYVDIDLKAKRAFKKRLARVLKNEILQCLRHLLIKITGIVELFCTMNEFLFYVFTLAK
ncbi:hypothetical protein HDV01_003829 [Terramyces sp. JEL0728]|nr:hypothetical protein HDV01_003829 [Terramyces sp. JEL0728]